MSFRGLKLFFPDLPTVAQRLHEFRLIFNLNSALATKELFLKRKSSVKWFNHDDRNNRYFFNACRGCWNCNKILCIGDQNGYPCSSHREVSATDVNYF